MATFNSNNMVDQKLAEFRRPLMGYVLENLKPIHLLKLHKCCKFFYHTYRTNIILNLEIVDDGQPEILDPCKSVIAISNPAFLQLKDFWISDSFVYNASANLARLPEFSHVTVKKLVACNHLLWSEFEALTKSGNIDELKIGYVVDAETNNVPLERIIAQVPRASSIEFDESVVIPTTFTTLMSLDRKTKFAKFVLHNLTIDFSQNDGGILIEYLVKNGSCVFDIDFRVVEDHQINVRMQEVAGILYECVHMLFYRKQQKQNEVEEKKLEKELIDFGRMYLMLQMMALF